MSVEPPSGAAIAADWLEPLLRRSHGFLAERTWDRRGLIAALAEQPHQARIASNLADPRTVAIVTGQQPAIGGGPLYTLVKAAHAAAIADALTARGQPAVPVFWCASEDHDLGEAGHADLVRRDGGIERVSHALGGGRQSLRFRPASLWWDRLMARCRERLGPGQGADFLTAQAPLADEGMGAWLCRLLAQLFGGRLAVVEGHRLRPLWPDRVEAALAQWPARELAELRRQLLQGGAADAFGQLDQPPLFVDTPRGREKLDVQAARRIARDQPLDLSPGAALRPVLQQAALPALAYVGGPGELAYHSFIAPIYGALAVPRPELLPRASIALAPSWLLHGLARWQVEPESIQADTPAPTFGATADPLEPRLATLADELAAVERAAADRPHLATRVARLRRALRRLEGAVQVERRHRQDLPAFGPLRDWLFPRGEPQERVMSLFQVLWEHGPGIADRLVEQAARCRPGQRAVLRLA